MDLAGCRCVRNVPNASHISNVTGLRQDGLLNDKPQSRWSCQLPECYMTFDLNQSFILDELIVCKEGQQNLGRCGGIRGRLK